jgi:sugar phosphate isomerase/epimerase
MKSAEIAAQLSTVKVHLETMEDFRDSLIRIKQVGYRAVELAWVDHLPAAEVAAALGESGLPCCAAHLAPECILREPAQMAQKVASWGASYLVYPQPENYRLASLEDIAALTSQLNSAGKIVREQGLSLVYHHRQAEFRRVEGKRIIDFILLETDPDLVLMEVDTYWVQAGGCYPVDWCRRLPGRLPLIHLKDFGLDESNQPMTTEVGSGNLNFPSIIAASEKAGCRWFVVEQDNPPGDPFASLEKSRRFLADFLVAGD